MLARKRSLVSCRVWWVSSRMFSFHRLASIELTAGLQISQPWPRPCPAMRSANVLISLTLTMSSSSCRVYGKCSQRSLLTLRPAASSSCLRRSVTNGRHPPQPVPARVRALTSPTVAQPPARTDAQMSPLLTPLHWQTCVSVGISVADTATPPPPEPSTSAPGSAGSSVPFFASIIEAAVVGRVADEDAAHEPPAVGAEQQLLVDAAERVLVGQRLGGVPRRPRSRRSSPRRPPSA